jgi:hypothetical protein
MLSLHRGITVPFRHENVHKPHFSCPKFTGTKRFGVLHQGKFALKILLQIGSPAEMERDCDEADFAR